MIVAEVVKICTKVMFKNHLYTFGGRTYRQKKGGPIGLRGTCAVARLVMCHWDRQWKIMMQVNRITLKEYFRYMDDGRALLAPLRPGWRWEGGELQFTLRWEKEDLELKKTGTEITREALGRSMQEVLPSLKFTTEVGEGEDEWLATLDTMMRVENSNLVSYRHYEKPSSTNVMVQRRSALEENSKNQILANDLVRRLGNNDVRQERKVVERVVDKFSKKLLTSGYSETQSRRIVINGIRGWEKRLMRSKAEKRNLFRTSKESMSGRI